MSKSRILTPPPFAWRRKNIYTSMAGRMALVDCNASDLQALHHQHPYPDTSLSPPNFHKHGYELSDEVDANDGDNNSCADTTSSMNDGSINGSENGGNNNSNGIIDGHSPGGYSTKSARYKMAMTTRARQRRLRRMRDPAGSIGGVGEETSGGGGGGGGGEPHHTQGHGGGENTNDAIAPLPPALPPTMSSPGPSARSHRIAAEPPGMSYPGTPGTPPISPQSKLQDNYRGRPSRAGVVPLTLVEDPPPRPSPSTISSGSSLSRQLFPMDESPPALVVTPSSAVMSTSVNPVPTAAREENETSRDVGGAAAVDRITTSPTLVPLSIDGRHDRSRFASAELINPRVPSPRTKQAPVRVSDLRVLPCTSVVLTTQEFLPNWKDMNGDGAGLSDDAIRDAANFTKIQFQCSGQGGEIEMLSGDEFFDESCASITETDDVTKKMNCSYSPSAIVLVPSDIDGFDEDNGEYDDKKQVWQNEIWSDLSAHSSTVQANIFHQKAASNLVSLLSADRMIEAGLMAPEINSCEEDDAARDVRGDSPWGEEDSPVGVNDNVNGNSSSPKLKKNFTFQSDANPSESRGGEWKGVTQVKRTLFRDDLDDDVKQSMIFQAFRKNMMEPSQQLKDLLKQINRERFTPIDRAYATRRKNACGALKILSAKEENKMKICWTVGVLPAIASVLSDVCEVRDSDDAISYAANTEARNRVVATLLNLSVNKKNRMLIVNTPGVMDSMTQTILHDMGEGRQGCCTVFLYLAKTAEARMMIVKCVGVMDALANVIAMPKAKAKERKPPTPKSKMRGRLIQNYKSMDNEVDTLRSLSDRGRNSRRYELSTDDSDSDSVSSNSSHSSTKSSGFSEDITSVTEESSIASGMIANMVEMTFSTADTASVANVTKTDRSAVTTIEPPSEDIYDADPNRFLHGARLSVFACLLCLVKSKENAFIIARDAMMIETLIGVSNRHPSPSHSRAIAVLAHLTRHPQNSHQLVFKYGSLLPALQAATGSPDKEARRYAVCALQNLSIDKSCRAPVAHSPKVIWSLIERCKDTIDEEDETRTAAMATLQNLSDEPANLIQFTIVENCIGTIIRVARADSTRGEETDLLSFMAKNTLATLSHWFRKIATSGAERARQTDIASTSMLGITGSLNGAAPGGTRAFVNLHNATLEPKFYEWWS